LEPYPDWRIGGGGMKTCSDCGLWKTEGELLKDLRYGRLGYKAWCKSCNKVRYSARNILHNRAYVEKNREKLYAKNRVATSGTPEARERTKGRHQEYHKRNPDYTFENNLKRNHGITVNQYHAMQKSQGNRCAICRKFETAKNKNGKVMRLAVDHHHKTGAIRALLCSLCNVGIGCFKGDAARMMKAVAYLEKHGLFSKEEVNENRNSHPPPQLNGD